MSPEAWVFFTTLLTLQAKQIDDRRRDRKEARAEKTTPTTRLEKKVDRLHTKLDQTNKAVTTHASDPLAHYEPRRRVR